MNGVLSIFLARVRKIPFMLLMVNSDTRIPGMGNNPDWKSVTVVMSSGLIPPLSVLDAAEVPTTEPMFK